MLNSTKTPWLLADTAYCNLGVHPAAARANGGRWTELIATNVTNDKTIGACVDKPIGACRQVESFDASDSAYLSCLSLCPLNPFLWALPLRPSFLWSLAARSGTAGAAPVLHSSASCLACPLPDGLCLRFPRSTQAVPSLLLPANGDAPRTSGPHSGVEDHIGPCHAAWFAAFVQCPSFGGSLPTADVVCCLASSGRSWCA